MTSISFEQGYKAGLHSKTFDVSDNIKRQDGRLLSKNASEIVQSMHRDPCLSFDEARLLAVQKEMARWGVDSTGMPTDPKAFTFGRRTVTTSDPEYPAAFASHSGFLDFSSGRAPVGISRQLAWLRALFKSFAPWPARHFMSVLQLSCVLVLVVLSFSLMRYLRVYGMAGLPTIVLEADSGFENGFHLEENAAASSAIGSADIADAPFGDILEQIPVESSDDGRGRGLVAVPGDPSMNVAWWEMMWKHSEAGVSDQSTLQRLLGRKSALPRSWKAWGSG